MNVMNECEYACMYAYLAISVTLLMASTKISHRITILIVVLALRLNCVLDFANIEPFLSPGRSNTAGFGCHTAQGYTRHAAVASDVFDYLTFPLARPSKKRITVVIGKKLFPLSARYAAGS